MRTLVFIPGNYGHNSRATFRDEIQGRLSQAGAHGLGIINVIDAESEYDTSEWGQLFNTLKLYKGNFDCVVIAIDGSRVNGDDEQLKRRIAAITETTSGMPIVAYVDEMGDQTAFDLFNCDFSFIVDRKHDQRTLPAAVGRAVALRSASGRVLKLGPLGIDITSGEVTLDDARVHMTKKETDLLLLLARRKGMVVGKDQIMGFLYGDEDQPEIKIVDVFICKIRKKLSELDSKYPILGSVLETVWGRGVRLNNYAPDDLRFVIGPLVLRYDSDQRKYTSLDDRHDYTELEVVVLGMMAEAGNKPVQLALLQATLADAEHGFFAIPALKKMLEILQTRVRNGAEGVNSMLREEPDGSWVLINPYQGRATGNSAARRHADILDKGTEEIVDGKLFRHLEGFSYVFVGDNIARLSANQFRIFKFLSAQKGRGFDLKDIYARVINPPRSMLPNAVVNMNAIVGAINKSMKDVEGYTRIHIIQNNQVVGMAEKLNQISMPVGNGGADGKSGKPEIDKSSSFRPASRGIGRDGSSIYEDGDLFDFTKPYTDIDTGSFTLRVNNRSKTASIPAEMKSFNPAETLFLLRVWYADGRAVAVADINKKTAQASLTAVAVSQKLQAKRPDRVGIIHEPVGGGFAFKMAQDEPMRQDRVPEPPVEGHPPPS